MSKVIHSHSDDNDIMILVKKGSPYLELQKKFKPEVPLIDLLSDYFLDYLNQGYDLCYYVKDGKRQLSLGTGTGKVREIK